MAKVLMKGNQALAEACLRAGCRFFSGYPITPQTEILEYLCWRMDEVGGVCVQTESELAGVNMLFGAAAAGARALTTTAGPGFSLKQEGISYLCSSDLPAVIVDVQRIGCGLGDIFMGQGDYWQLTRGGGHGDYHTLVLAPASVQESVELASEAFDLAEKYRHPVIMATDATIGQMMEPVELPDFVEPKRTPWALNGHYTYKKIGIFERDSMAEAVELRAKYAEIKENEQRWEEEDIADADYVFVAYGVPGRATLGAVRELRAAGEKVGLIRPITAWPYPEKAFANINPNVKGIITVEENATGQMIDDAALAIKKTHKDRNIPAYALTYVYNTPPINRIKEDYFKVKSGEIKEVY